MYGFYFFTFGKKYNFFKILDFYEIQYKKKNYNLNYESNLYKFIKVLKKNFINNY